jgi:hypothetical protein
VNTPINDGAQKIYRMQAAAVLAGAPGLSIPAEASAGPFKRHTAQCHTSLMPV